MKLEKGQRKQSEVVKGSQTPLCKVFFWNSWKPGNVRIHLRSGKKAQTQGKGREFV